MKKVFLFFILIMMILSLSGCSGGIQGDEAKAHINQFFDAIEAKDYESAAGYLHPERPADLKKFFEGLEKEGDLDFSNIEIDQYTGFSSSYYDSTVNGSAYRLKMNAHIGGKKVKMEIEIVKNNRGYGIFNLDIDP